ncbi:ef hand family protein [Stylonychia lemnae]|uniref:Ef hand family protein n=1 Tax=Stylonychia lemnae TaxID=5949 RepID=A0A078AFP2_STYLE|nr:ef hand family protein [Stylonychia lemnae]|eukprot:CDW80651.1 ef hand family protein [Stylonychia lemnae]
MEQFNDQDNLLANISNLNEKRISQAFENIQQTFAESVQRTSTKRIISVNDDDHFNIHINPKLKNYHTMKWLQNRYFDRAKKEYILTDHQIKDTLAMETLFIRFDEDNSGTLELKELIKMFRENQINISDKIIRELFRFADQDHSGTLTLEEFKSLLVNEQALDRFRELMIQERKKAQRKSSEPLFMNSDSRDENQIRFLPTDLRDMLKLLINRMQHSGLQKKLEKVSCLQNNMAVKNNFKPMKLNKAFFRMDGDQQKQKMKNLDLDDRVNSNEDFEKNINGTRYLTKHLQKVPTKKLNDMRSRNTSDSNKNLHALRTQLEPLNENIFELISFTQECKKNDESTNNRFIDRYYSIQQQQQEENSPRNKVILKNVQMHSPLYETLSNKYKEKLNLKKFLLQMKTQVMGTAQDDASIDGTDIKSYRLDSIPTPKLVSMSSTRGSRNTSKKLDNVIGSYFKVNSKVDYIKTNKAENNRLNNITTAPTSLNNSRFFGSRKTSKLSSVENSLSPSRSQLSTRQYLIKTTQLRKKSSKVNLNNEYFHL